MQVFGTVLAGLLIFLLGQAALKFFLDPLQELRRTISDIALALIEHADVYANPGLGEKEESHEVSRHFRNLASKLHAQAYLIPKYHRAVYLGFPSEEVIAEVSGQLIGISNRVFESSPPRSSDANVAAASKIRKLLGIPVPKGSE